MTHSFFIVTQLGNNQYSRDELTVDVFYPEDIDAEGKLAAIEMAIEQKYGKSVYTRILGIYKL